MSIPTSPLAARVAYSFQDYYPGGWRNCYYLLIAINGTSMIAWFLFYREFLTRVALWLEHSLTISIDPPTFSMLHRKKLARDLLLHFDWPGMFLYTGGLIIFIFGLNWGGVL